MKRFPFILAKLKPTVYVANGRDPSVVLQDFIILQFLAALKFRKYHLLKTLIPHRCAPAPWGRPRVQQKGSTHEFFNFFLVQLQITN